MLIEEKRSSRILPSRKITWKFFKVHNNLIFRLERWSKKFAKQNVFHPRPLLRYPAYCRITDSLHAIIQNRDALRRHSRTSETHTTHFNRSANKVWSFRLRNPLRVSQAPSGCHRNEHRAWDTWTHFSAALSQCSHDGPTLNLVHLKPALYLKHLW